MGIEISTNFIKLDSFLKLCGEAESGGHAKNIIAQGQVRVKDEVCLQRGKKLYPGDEVEFNNIIYMVKSYEA
ncbi:MAG: RNA-binding S4 domain-containing protein [Clostridiales bacterium]|nr:RNA-binding S4 domain-containing protein [Clostridiales bacterium]